MALPAVPIAISCVSRALPHWQPPLPTLPALTVGRRSEKRRARRQCRVFRSETPGWRLEARRGFINGQIQGGKVGRGLDFSRLFGPSTFKPFLRMGSADYLRQLAPNKLSPTHSRISIVHHIHQGNAILQYSTPSRPDPEPPFRAPVRFGLPCQPLAAAQKPGEDMGGWRRMQMQCNATTDAAPLDRTKLDSAFRRARLEISTVIRRRPLCPSPFHPSIHPVLHSWPVRIAS